jgi:hypothetical protein
MARSMYNFGKQSKEKARQQKQIDKAAKRILAKQQKANMKTQTPNGRLDIDEPVRAEEIDDGDITVS